MEHTGVELFNTQVRNSDELGRALMLLLRMRESLELDHCAVARLQAFVAQAWSESRSRVPQSIKITVFPGLDPPALELNVRAPRPDMDPLPGGSGFFFFPGEVSCERIDNGMSFTGWMDAPEALAAKLRLNRADDIRSAIASEFSKVGSESGAGASLSSSLIEMLSTSIGLLSQQAEDARAIDALRTELEDLNRELAYMGEQIEMLTVVDRLTGLYNRSKFDAVVETEIARAERQGIGFSLMLIDLDRFEDVNQQQGHHLGDEVLAEVGRLLAINTRKLVDSCFRFGGDEFAVILIGADSKQSRAVADRILRAFRRVDQLGITMSMGLTSFQLGESKDALIARVDGAMYRAKQAGGNTVIDL